MTAKKAKTAEAELETTEVVSVEMEGVAEPEVAEYMEQEDALLADTGQPERISNLKLKHKDEGKGDFFLDDAQSITFPSGNFALVKSSMSRQMFETPYDPENMPLCRSYDGKVPADDIEGETPRCHSCEIAPDTIGPGKKQKYFCEFANWSTNSKGKIIKPACSNTINLLLLNLDMGILVRYACYVTAYPPADKQLLTPLKKMLKFLNINRMREGKTPAKSWMFSFELSSVVDPKRGESYVPVFSNLKVMDDEMINMLYPIAAQASMETANYIPPKDENGKYIRKSDDDSNSAAGGSMDDDF